MAIIILIVFQMVLGIIIGEVVWKYSKLKNKDK
jgi:hypothetical protein